jgi:hypothetical protein
MGKEESKNTDLQKQNEEGKRSRSEQDHGRDQQVHQDRSARHLSEIDRREGEMHHGETGGNFRNFDHPDRA